MKKIEFSDEQKSGIIFFLKKRNTLIHQEYSNGLNNRKWNNFYVKPLTTAMIKLEGNGKISFTEKELIMIESCINDYAPTEIYLDTINNERERIIEPFRNALKKL